MSSINVSDSDFEKNVLKSEKPVLVDFWAEWCGPCKAISPVLEEIAREKKDQLVVVKLNIDENPETPVKYSVRGIPTMLLFYKGKVVATKVGAEPKATLNQWLEGQLVEFA